MYGIDVNINNDLGMNALFMCDISKARVLINAGINVNKRTKVGYTAFQYAFINRDVSLADLMIEAGLLMTYKEQLKLERII